MAPPLVCRACGRWFALFARAPDPRAAPVRSSSPQCTAVAERLTTPCCGADVVVRDAEATADPGAYEDEIRAFRGSWTDRALPFQAALAGDVGMRDAPWVGTHNSFNSIAEMGTTVS